MSMFYPVSLAGHPSRPLISREPFHDMIMHQSSRLSTHEFEEGQKINLEDWVNECDCVFISLKRKWVEIQRTAWCWPELTYYLDYKNG